MRAASHRHPPVIGEPLEEREQRRRDDQQHPDLAADPRGESLDGSRGGARDDERLPRFDPALLGVRKIRGEGGLRRRIRLGGDLVEARAFAEEDRPSVLDGDLEEDSFLTLAASATADPVITIGPQPM